MKIFSLKFIVYGPFLLMAALSGCLMEKGRTFGSPRVREMPPWGSVEHQGEIWTEGRPIMKNPATATMQEVFLDLGFYDSDRSDVIGGELGGKLWISSKDYFFYRGAGANPKLEIFRKRGENSVLLEVYVANSAGFDQSLTWRYVISYDFDSNHWVFKEIGISDSHQWRAQSIKVPVR